MTKQNILPRQPQPGLSIISWALQLALGKHRKDKQARCRFIKLLVQVEGWGPSGGRVLVGLVPVSQGFSGSPLLSSLLPPASPHPHPEEESGKRATLLRPGTINPHKTLLLDEETAEPKG